MLPMNGLIIYPTPLGISRLSEREWHLAKTPYVLISTGASDGCFWARCWLERPSPRPLEGDILGRLWLASGLPPPSKSS